MRPHEVDLGLGNGAHPDLVEGTCEEGGKGAAEDDVPVSTGQADAHSSNVLFCDEALHVALVKRLLVSEGEGGVLGVSIQSHDTVVVLA